MNIETMLLEKIKFEYGTIIPGDVIGNLTIEQVIDFETNASKVFFRTFILGRKVREEIKEQIKIYDSWWDYFKGTLQPYLPIWAIKFFKARYHLQPITINHYHLCPHTGLDFRGHNAMEHFNFLCGVET